MTYDEAKRGLMAAMNWTNADFAKFMLKGHGDAEKQLAELEVEFNAWQSNPHAAYYYDCAYELHVGPSGPEPTFDISFRPTEFGRMIEYNHWLKSEGIDTSVLLNKVLLDA